MHGKQSPAKAITQGNGEGTKEHREETERESAQASQVKPGTQSQEVEWAVLSWRNKHIEQTFP
jgi:hypothetical protein